MSSKPVQQRCPVEFANTMYEMNSPVLFAGDDASYVEAHCLLTLTPKADKALHALCATHLSEIRRDAPQLIKLLSQISTRRRNGDSSKQAYRCLDMVKRIRTGLKTACGYVSCTKKTPQALQIIDQQKSHIDHKYISLSSSNIIARTAFEIVQM